MGVRLVQLMLVALIVAVPATAQPPLRPEIIGQFIDLEMSVDPPEQDIVRGETVTFNVTVRNRAPNPEPSRIEATVVPPDEAWRADLDVSTFELTGGQARTIQLSVTALQDLEVEAFSVQVYVIATYPAEGAVNQVQARQDAEANLVLQENFLESFAIDAGVALWVVLGILIGGLAAGLTVLWFQRDRLAIRSDCADTEAQPGSVVSLPFTLRNRGRRAETVELAANPLPPGWHLQFDSDHFRVPGRAIVEREILVTVPTNAAARTQVSVAAQSGERDEAAVLDLIVRRAP